MLLTSSLICLHIFVYFFLSAFLSFFVLFFGLIFLHTIVVVVFWLFQKAFFHPPLPLPAHSQRCHSATKSAKLLNWKSSLNLPQRQQREIEREGEWARERERDPQWVHCCCSPLRLWRCCCICFSHTHTQRASSLFFSPHSYLICNALMLQVTSCQRRHRFSIHFHFHRYCTYATTAAAARRTTAPPTAAE